MCTNENMPSDTRAGVCALPIPDPLAELKNGNPGSAELGTHVCQVCHQSFNNEWALGQHCRSERHATWICHHSGCNSRFFSKGALDAHLTTPHLPDHHEVWDASAIACAECGKTFTHYSQWEDEGYVLNHAKSEKHSAFACSCGAKFARKDVLIRHLKSLTKESAKYQCTFCRRYRGRQAFRRRDHLVQHLRGYHKMEPEEINDISPPATRLTSRQVLICPHSDCEFHRDAAFRSLSWEKQLEGRPFKKQCDYNKHMRDVHKESTFSCRVAGCDRVGAKGYMREKDLMKHIADKHPEAPSYTYVRSRDKYRCVRCGQRFDTVGILLDHEKRAQYCQRRANNSNTSAVETSG
ncbi:hypothetical protein HD806DRAFT_225327 [Xylariaceae sp. AK1471]|nr:hypothetical protein HD806DRAFT_225327 [Xylariaceae sp. AK1471]